MPTPELSADQVPALVTDLVHLVRSGLDERAQIDHVANRLRLKKRPARSVVEAFQRGYHAGIGAALERQTTEIPDGSPLWREAYRQGCVVTEELVRTTAQRRRASAHAAPRARPMALFYTVAAVVFVGLVLWL